MTTKTEPTVSCSIKGPGALGINDEGVADSVVHISVDILREWKSRAASEASQETGRIDKWVSLSYEHKSGIAGKHSS